MTKRRKILAISGSTRKISVNLNLIHAIISLFSAGLDFEIFNSLEGIPQFNPDLDRSQPPEPVLSFRQKLREAGGILICTPEYAMGVPGALKNAIDWTVSSMEFSHKPVALITASTAGHKGHRSLLETLQVIECDIPNSSQLLISFANTKLNGNQIIHQETLEQVKSVVNSLIASIEKSEATLEIAD